MAEPKRQQNAKGGEEDGGGDKKKQRVVSCGSNEEGEEKKSDESHSTGKSRRSHRTSTSVSPSSLLPQLPALIWSRILSDYIPHNFPTLLCFSSVNKFFLHEVIPTIERIAIYKTCELHLAPLHRFKSVTSAEICCLVRLPSDGVGRVVLRLDGELLRRLRPGQELDVDASRRIPLFLSRLGPTLKKAFIGATRHETYDEDICLTHGHREAYRELIRSLCSAYRMGAISPTLDLATLRQGPFCEYDKELYDFTDVDHEPCDTCRDVCRSFPFDDVIRFPVCRDRPLQASFCMSDEERLEIIAGRNGGMEYLRSPHTMMKVIKSEATLAWYRKPLSGDELVLKETDKFYGMASALCLRKERRKYMKLLSQFGCDWSPIDGPTFRRLTFEHLNTWLCVDDTGAGVLHMFQNVHDFLRAVGVPMKLAKYIPVPDEWDVENKSDSEVEEEKEGSEEEGMVSDDDDNGIDSD